MAGRVNQRNESSIITIIVYIANSTALATVFTRFNQNNKQTNQPTNQHRVNMVQITCLVPVLYKVIYTHSNLSILKVNQLSCIDDDGDGSFICG